MNVPQRGANTYAKEWFVTKTEYNRNLFRVVDDLDKNVATYFTSDQKAMEYLSFYKSKVNSGGESVHRR